MIISHRHRFIFIKTRKTASTSMEISLSRYCDPEDVLTPIAPKDEAERRKLGIEPRNYQGIFNPVPELLHGEKAFRIRSAKDFLKRRRYYNHLSAYRVRNRLGKTTWDSYFKFCFERDPWDKSLSHFHWKNRERQVYRDLDHYLGEAALCHNSGLYMIDGRVAVDFIGRYENMETDMARAMEEIGLDFDFWLPRAKAGIRRDQRPHGEALSESQKERIERAFEDEIRLLGYERP